MSLKVIAAPSHPYVGQLPDAQPISREAWRDNGSSPMKFVLAAAFGLLSGAALLATSAIGQTAPDLAKGQAIFEERCKACHDPAVDRAPTREDLAARPPADIVAALTTGPMVPVAEGLTPEDKQAVAAYLTTKP
jgi:mono/diheme cytochrome c family protein